MTNPGLKNNPFYVFFKEKWFYENDNIYTVNSNKIFKFFGCYSKYNIKILESLGAQQENGSWRYKFSVIGKEIYLFGIKVKTIKF